MLLTFTKMQGLGNDFVVIDNRDGAVELTEAQRRFLADRHFGVGCDQILMIEQAPNADSDFTYRIFNADGGEVEQCGNGARCFARYVRERGLIDRDRIRVQTRGGLLELLYAKGGVTVNMGVPVFAPARIPFITQNEAPGYRVELGGRDWEFGAVSMGNPHVTLRVEDIDSVPVAQWGPLWQRHAAFPKSVNVGFAQRLSANHIKLRVFERGTGETLACGSGACAAVAIGRRQGWLDADVQVDLPGGSLRVQWASEAAPVMMSGPAEFVFNGQIEL